jgi:hypothetical protein
METLIAWLQSYSLPVTVLLLIGAALLFVMKLVTERAVEAQFSRLTKEVELRLEQRSRFEEKIMLDQYAAASKTFAQIQAVATSVNRYLHGQPTEGLFKGTDLVPLTEVYEAIEAQRYLLGERLCELLEQLAGCVLRLANADSAAAREQVGKDYAALRTAFHAEMRDAFGISPQRAGQVRQPAAARPSSLSV